MNKLFIILVFCISLFLMGCSKDEEESNTIPVTYLDQDLQGIINGEPWDYKMGSVTTWLPTSSYSHDFSIVDSIQNDTCFILGNERSKIIFSLNDNSPLLTIGEHTLLLDWDQPEISKTVTFVYYEDNSPLNLIAQNGTFEILTVDTTHKVVTGKMKVSYDNENSINGNFTLKYCNW